MWRGLNNYLKKYAKFYAEEYQEILYKMECPSDTSRSIEEVVKEKAKEKAQIEENINTNANIFVQYLAENFVKNCEENYAHECAKYYLKALDCAYEWSKSASNLWNKEGLFFYGEYTKALDKLDNPEKNGDRNALNVELDYVKLWKEWNNSSEKLGSINPGEKSKEIIQLWRGEGTLPGYICVGGLKRDAINQLVSSISEFNHNDLPKHPLSCVLTSSPGWGKSFLAKSLAKYFNMEFIEFSIAQMSTSRDLIDCLSTISSVQNRTQKKTLIFIDEINAKIEGNDVMSLLLSPLWDGTFVDNGKSYRLSPAVWVFASTDRLGKIIEEIPKGSDFASRLNGPIIDLDLLGAGEVFEYITDVRGCGTKIKNNLTTKTPPQSFKTITYTLFPIYFF